MLKALTTKSREDVEGGVTTFSDGTVAYWDEAVTFYVTKDETVTKKFNNRDDMPYRQVFNGEDYGLIGEMSDSDFATWSKHFEGVK